MLGIICVMSGILDMVYIEYKKKHCWLSLGNSRACCLSRARVIDNNWQKPLDVISSVATGLCFFFFYQWLFCRVFCQVLCLFVYFRLVVLVMSNAYSTTLLVAVHLLNSKSEPLNCKISIWFQNVLCPSHPHDVCYMSTKRKLKKLHWFLARTCKEKTRHVDH